MSAVVAVDDLTFTYPKSAQPAVRGMSFEVDEGEVFGFLGPSGAGKSTTQKILIGLLGGHGGDVSVWGKSPAEWKAAYYQRIGVSFELPNHYQKLTGLENLEFFASLYPGEKEDPMRLLDRVGLAEHANLRVAKYSKGMQMRLVFIRALLHKPRLLFLDEPTSGMDPANARIVKDIIRELRAEGRTVFLTTHDMTTADQLCDRVAFVVDGKIAALDSPAEHKVRRSHRTVRVAYRTPAFDDLQHKDFAMDTLADDDAFATLVRTRSVEAMHSQEASLEDVFIDITGRTLQ
ncbi:ABC transporter ATP-binding protein [Tenggerimyces flavus]|uniref:ABC transporter ATP-binding protein n=1 Tax=Tenggerimyces flavus TaxID=1708749 RepID=A0ABV7YAF6_9ACTN|nr:ABC transporter ATP-binding protein [Tenggerimyces flavus]MBM7789155.1 fluoroquinolone transport system ATP-binding protein [Tenggerimyces flavus]